MPVPSLETISEAVKQVCEKHRVRRLRVFGSTVRGEERPGSDVDLLVDYDPGFTPTFAPTSG
jgi:predicted nucleotidyltransferase